MKINNITLEFSSEELEALHYVIELGIRSYQKGKIKPANDWIEIAERIRQVLPTRLRLLSDKWDKAGDFLK